MTDLLGPTASITSRTGTLLTGATPTTGHDPGVSEDLVPVRYAITHKTVYRYAEPVIFGEHRLLFRPRDSHDLRVLGTDLKVSPASNIRLIQDAHSNSVAIVQPKGLANELTLTASFLIEHANSNNLELPIDPAARYFPFSYSVDERIDLEHYLRPQYDDPHGVLGEWSRQFIRTDGPTETRDMLVRMNEQIRATMRYQIRHEEGTQAPLTTLLSGSGTCRDFANLMMEAGRKLGVATRFVSGYLYDPVLSVTGQSGTTHAWLQAYLPGAGWVNFDPTNNLLGGTRLIRVGVARHPGQAAPVSGTWFGPSSAFLGMSVDVQVRQIDQRVLSTT